MHPSYWSIYSYLYSFFRLPRHREYLFLLIDLIQERLLFVLAAIAGRYSSRKIGHLRRGTCNVSLCSPVKSFRDLIRAWHVMIDTIAKTLIARYDGPHRLTFDLVTSDMRERQLPRCKRSWRMRQDDCYARAAYSRSTLSLCSHSLSLSLSFSVALADGGRMLADFRRTAKATFFCFLYHNVSIRVACSYNRWFLLSL